MSFSRDLKKIANQKKMDLEDVYKGALLDVCSMVIMESPHDTGRFRLNWNAGIDQIDPSTNEEEATEQESREKAIGKMQAALFNEFKIGSTFYMSNNLPYAIPLEYGHSAQAPSGVLRKSVKSFKRMVKDRAAGKV